MVEQRWHIRWPVKINVMLYQSPTVATPGLATNLSANGLFLQENTQQLTEGTAVEVEFCNEFELHQNQKKLPAIVIHQTKSGTGLMIYPFDAQTQSAIEYLLTRVRQSSH